jgi:transcriptional regulator with XRE-family HTH domain
MRAIWTHHNLSFRSPAVFLEPTPRLRDPMLGLLHHIINSETMLRSLNVPMSPNNRQFAAFITAHREKLGLSQNQIAKQIGTSRSSVHYWESGEWLPGVVQLEPLARALGVSYEDLFVLAGYTHPKGLPSNEVFLRTMFPRASKRKLAEAERIYAELEAEEERREKRKGRRT